MTATLRLWGIRLEKTLAGAPTGVVRQNMYRELRVSVAYGLFFASTVGFLPVVLRWIGASSEMLALYTSQLFVGSALASLSIVIMCRRRTMSFVVVCWAVGRAMFLVMAFSTQAIWMIVLSGLFWLLEIFPSPGYTRILQTIYPTEVRGKIMSTVRLGRVGAILLMTPLAGWALDHWGYPVLFPLASLPPTASTLFCREESNISELLSNRETLHCGISSVRDTCTCVSPASFRNSCRVRYSVRSSSANAVTRCLRSSDN